MGLKESLANLKYQLKAQWDMGAEEGKRLKKKHKNYVKEKIKKR